MNASAAGPERGWRLKATDLAAQQSHDREHRGSERRPHAEEAFAATQRWAFNVGAEGWSLVSRLPQVRAKTLIIAGKTTRSCPWRIRFRASQLVEDGDVRILEPCGHRLVRDCPTEFVHAVNHFLDAV
jgi:pimeloyl-ACP methyl ester carboxylesterase